MNEERAALNLPNWSFHFFLFFYYTPTAAYTSSAPSIQFKSVSIIGKTFIL
jgi:hypothetical protein